MENFVRRKNIQLYRSKLAETQDEAERQMLLRLLEEEEAKENADEQDTGQG